MQLDLLYVQLYHDCRIIALPVYGYATLLKILVIAPLSQAVQRVNATTCNTTTNLLLLLMILVIFSHLLKLLDLVGNNKSVKRHTRGRAPTSCKLRILFLFPLFNKRKRNQIYGNRTSLRTARFFETRPLKFQVDAI